MNEPASTLSQPAPLARGWALVALCDATQKRLYELRSARLYAIGVFVSYAVLLLLTRGRDNAPLLAELTHDALVTLTYMVGTLSGLGVARSFARSEEWRPLFALAGQRGHSAQAVGRARLFASAYRCALLLGLPALALIALACACGKSAGWAVTTSATFLLYAALAGSAVTGFARLAAWLSPRHARAWLLLLGAGPLLLALGFPWFPSLPGALSWALERIALLGARFA